MSTDAAYEEGVGQIPPQGGQRFDGMATTEGSVRRLVLPTSGGCYGRIGVVGDRELHIWPPEHSSAIHCN